MGEAMSRPSVEPSDLDHTGSDLDHTGDAVLPSVTPMPMPLVGQGRGSRGSRGKVEKHRVAVLGGSFDPITDGHLKCACEIVHMNVADEVWIVPCGRRPDKPSLKTPYMQRLIMCAAPMPYEASAWH